MAALKEPRPAAIPAPAPLNAAPDAARRSLELHASARPLIALATQLRMAVVHSPERLKLALAVAVERFEAALAGAGWDQRAISAASYLLCTWVDEVVADTPWGAGDAGLLQRFHGERRGSDRILRLLSRLAESPQDNRPLLELFHTCLSLGLNGHLRGAGDGAQQQLDQLRARVFLTLPPQQTALAPPWQAAVKPDPRSWRHRLWLVALLLLGLVTLGVYTVSHLRLAARVDEVFSAMQQIPTGGAPAPASGATVPAQPGPPRLAPLLAQDVAAGRLTVRDEAHRSVVSVPADAVFEPGSTAVAASAAPLIARIGAALASHDGKVLVIGHTDGSDRRSARLPSAWHQSYEWAREAANALGRVLPAERLSVEGAADLERPDQRPAVPPVPPLPRRRLDIVLFP